jgi:hypothetical protein
MTTTKGKSEPIFMDILPLAGRRELPVQQSSTLQRDGIQRGGEPLGLDE